MLTFRESVRGKIWSMGEIKCIEPPPFTLLCVGHWAFLSFSSMSMQLILLNYACCFYATKLQILGRQGHCFLLSYMFYLCIENALKKHLSSELLLRTSIYLWMVNLHVDL